VWGNRTTVYVNALYEKDVSGNLSTKYYYLGGQRIAMRRGSTLTYLHGDHLGSASLTTNASGAKVSIMRYLPYGGLRVGGMSTDRRFTGQREEVSLGFYDYGARPYDPALGRFLQADTIVPNPADPQSLNRYAYTLNNPLRYTDPTGHIANNPNELTRADEILQILLNDYGVTVNKDWGMIGIGNLNLGWCPGSWQLAELETVLNGVSDFARLMGGAQQFRDNLGGVQFMRQAMSAPGQATAHKVWLKSIGSGGFSGQWEGTWTVVHELAHAWDAVNNWQFSKDLEDYTGGKTTRRHGYNYGGIPPKGADANFTREEDWAESVATFVYPRTAQAFIQTYYPNTPDFQYSNYYTLPRADFVAQQVNMDPQRLLFLQGNRW